MKIITFFNFSSIFARIREIDCIDIHQEELVKVEESWIPYIKEMGYAERRSIGSTFSAVLLFLLRCFYEIFLYLSLRFCLVTGFEFSSLENRPFPHRFLKNCVQKGHLETLSTAPTILSVD